MFLRLSQPANSSPRKIGLLNQVAPPPPRLPYRVGPRPWVQKSGAFPLQPDLKSSTFPWREFCGLAQFASFLMVFLASFLFGKEKVLLCNDTSNWYHWGCTGTSTALKEGIQKLGFEVNALSIQKTYSLSNVPDFEAFHSHQKFRQFCEGNKDVVLAIEEADAVVINGEGTLHDLRAGPRSLLYLAYISKEFFGKHVEIVNHSVYPKDDISLSADFLKNFDCEKEKTDRDLQQAEEVYRSIYAKLDFVAIRELLSQSTMQGIGVASTLSFDCLPLYIRDHYHKTKRTKDKTIVLSGSVAFTEAGAEQICRYLEDVEKMGFKIEVLIGAAAFPARDDELFVDFLRGHCTAHWTCVRASSMEEWLDTISQAKLLLSGRFHHSIAAFCLNTPFIALNSNTQKVHAICALLDQEAPLSFSDPELRDQLLLRMKGILHSPEVDNKEKFMQLCELAERNFQGLHSRP